MSHIISEKTPITEEMYYRARLCEYALKHGVTKAARRYQTNRQFVYRQLARYDGTPRSLALRSRRPHSHPKQHTEEELSLIKRIHRRNGKYGLAQTYVRCRAHGYTRSFGSMCRQIRKKGIPAQKPSRTSYVKYQRDEGAFPGDKVQIDVKYVPQECIRFPSYGNRYYQITAIDEFSRKRVLSVVREKSTYETARFLENLEKAMGFPIHRIQVDNGTEFVTDRDKTDRISPFELVCRRKGYELKRTRPYSPWQNGKVERSHREDQKILYQGNIFTSEKELKREVEKHCRRYNHTAKKILGFRSPAQVALETLSSVTYVLTL